MNWLEVVGWTGSALLVWSLLQTAILRLRALNLVGCLILIGYNGAVRVWPMVGLNAVLTVINVVHLYRLITTRHDERAYEVVRVGTDDAPMGGRAESTYRYTVIDTIGGGTSEVQKNIIARRKLGLPKNF